MNTFFAHKQEYGFYAQSLSVPYEQDETTCSYAHMGILTIFVRQTWKMWRNPLKTKSGIILPRRVQINLWQDEEAAEVQQM